LHELAKLDCVTELQNVKHFHLEIRYDPALDALVYDRKLKPGSGTAIYGLEIAKAMGMDDEFIEMAHSIRRQLLQTDKEVVSERSSRYNANVFMKPCQVCNSQGSDVHHIKEQAMADSRGYVGNVHKNDSSNLVVLCKECHDKVHQSKTLQITGYIQTDNGRKLQFKDSTQVPLKQFEKYKYKLRPRSKTGGITDISIPQQIIC
jgi:DNA mismatch repair protein MutS